MPPAERATKEACPIDLEKMVKRFKAAAATAASDWVTELGLDVILLYRCGKCLVYPIKSCSWWRCTTDDTKSVRVSSRAQQKVGMSHRIVKIICCKGVVLDR